MLNIKDVKFTINAGVKGGDKVDALAKSVQSLDGVGGTLARTFQGRVVPALGALTGALSVGAVVAFSKSVVNLADDLNDLSQKTGVSVEQLAGLKVAAESSGSSLEGIAASLNKLNKSAFEATKGTGDQAAAFKALGVDVKDAEGKIRPADKLLLDIADRFEELPDGAEKAAIAVALFGKSGADMIPFLNQGREEIGRFGLAISSTFASKADAFNDSLVLAKNSLISVAADGIEPLLPVMTDMVSGFSNAVSSVGNETSALGQIVATTTNALGESVGAVADFGGAFFEAVEGPEALGFALTGIETLVKSLAAGFVKFTGILEQTVNTASRLKNLVKGGALTVGEWTGLYDGDAGAVVAQDYAAGAAASVAITQRTDARIQSILNPTAGGAATAPGGRGRGGSTGFSPENGGGKKEADILADFIRKQHEAIQAIEDEAAAIGMTSYEINRLKEMREFDNEVSEKAAKLSGKKREEFLKMAEALRAEKLATMDYANEQSRAFGAGAAEAFAEYADSAGNAAESAKKMFSDAFDKMEDALVEFTMTGKLSFKDMANSIISDIVRMQVRQNVTGPLSGFLNSSLSNLFGGGVSSSATFAGMSIPTDYPAFASGGRHSGGLRIVGEDGPELEATGPARIYNAEQTRQMLAGGGGTSVTVNVNMANGQTTTQGDGKELGLRISGAVKQIIQNEMRAGGMLAGRG